MTAIWSSPLEGEREREHGGGEIVKIPVLLRIFNRRPLGDQAEGGGKKSKKSSPSQGLTATAAVDPAAQPERKAQ